MKTIVTMIPATMSVRVSKFTSQHQYERRQLHVNKRGDAKPHPVADWGPPFAVQLSVSFILPSFKYSVLRMNTHGINALFLRTAR
jgi:hypothetical protein